MIERRDVSGKRAPTVSHFKTSERALSLQVRSVYTICTHKRTLKWIWKWSAPSSNARNRSLCWTWITLLYNSQPHVTIAISLKSRLFSSIKYILSKQLAVKIFRALIRHLWWIIFWIWPMGSYTKRAARMYHNRPHIPNPVPTKTRNISLSASQLSRNHV